MGLSFKSKPVVVASTIATLIGGAYLLKDRLGGKPYDPSVLLTGKVAIVTGANTGIGKETVRDLAKRGAKVYMACRDMNRCEESRQEIVLDTKNKYVYCRPCDLASLKSIRKFVKHFNGEESRLDILINNAGVMRCPQSKTEDGFEMHMGVNHFGHFLLTNLLLDTLKKSAPSRIVNVTSLTYMRGTINKKDLNSENYYDQVKAYNQSKLANVLFTKELAKRLEGTGVTANCLHPGIVDTEITRHTSFYASWITAIFLKPFLWPFIKTPKQGAFMSIYLAVDPSLVQVNGGFFSDGRQFPIDEALDEKTSMWLWTVSEKWTKLSQKANV